MSTQEGILKVEEHSPYILLATGTYLLHAAKALFDLKQIHLPAPPRVTVSVRGGLRSVLAKYPTPCCELLQGGEWRKRMSELEKMGQGC